MAGAEVAVVVLAVVVLALVGLLVYQARAHERQVVELGVQTERALLLMRSETIDQYAAAEARLTRERMAELRAEPKPLMEGQGVAPKRASTLDLLWRRAPRRARQTIPASGPKE